MCDCSGHQATEEEESLVQESALVKHFLKKCKSDFFATMKSSASFRIAPRSSNLSTKVSKRNLNHNPSETSVDGISFHPNSSESQTCHNFEPISKGYLGEPLEDFDSPQTNVSQIIAKYRSEVNFKLSTFRFSCSQKIIRLTLKNDNVKNYSRGRNNSSSRQTSDAIFSSCESVASYFNPITTSTAANRPKFCDSRSPKYTIRSVMFCVTEKLATNYFHGELENDRERLKLYRF